MKLVEMKCKNCGAKLKLDPESKDANCQFCGAHFKIDDEVQHVKYDDMEQAGYEFEKGKIRAREEYKRSTYRDDDVEIETPKKKGTVWKVLAWIFLFPFMLTYTICVSKKMDKKTKIIVLVSIWTLFIIIAVANSQALEKKKEMIIKCYSEEVYEKLDKIIGISYINGIDSETTCDNLILKNSEDKEIKIIMNSNGLEKIIIDEKVVYAKDE